MAFKKHIYERFENGMTVDELIALLQEAKENGVKGDAPVIVSVRRGEGDTVHYVHGQALEGEVGIRETEDGYQKTVNLRGKEESVTI